jgi:hypothetical protein
MFLVEKRDGLSGVEWNQKVEWMKDIGSYESYWRSAVVKVDNFSMI